jgi:hypothetical protein
VHPSAVTAPRELPLGPYAKFPMADGDAVLFLDGTVCLEVSGLADQWDAALRRNLADMLTTLCTDVVLAVARRRSRLRPHDHAMWAELREEMLGSAVALAPLLALPARGRPGSRGR